MAAVSAGPERMPLVELLCSSHPPPRLDVCNRAGCSALMLASLMGNEPAVRFLLNMRPPPNVSLRDNSGANAVQLAANVTIRTILEQALDAESKCVLS